MTIADKRLFLPINPGGAVRPFPNNLESMILHNEGIFMRGKNPRQLPIILGADVKGNLTLVQSSSEGEYNSEVLHRFVTAQVYGCRKKEKKANNG